jgi:hypothetical protein
MRTSIPTKCPKCEQVVDASLRLDEIEAAVECKCGWRETVLLAGFSIGDKLIARAQHEFIHYSDYSLSIVFSAMAVDCELSHLFIKFKRAESMFKPDQPNEARIEEELRKVGSVDKLVDEVAILYSGVEMSCFVSSQPELSRARSNYFSNLHADDMARSIQRELFWPRNRVLHQGRSDFNRGQAEDCLKLALFVLDILHTLEDYLKQHGLPGGQSPENTNSVD